jgi:NAD(P)-dependent dehydrogenase (short-subunit alcohol dehydrogenase family)
MATQAEIPSQLGKTAVVTGATGGLGYETALALSKAGAEVILTGRDDRKGQSAIERIGREVIGAKVSFEHLDLASLASIADFAQRMGARQSLDLLINNAGVMALPRRQTTADGFEMQFGTNHLGHFALTARLMPLLRRASGARVVSLSSLAHRTGLIDFGDLQGERLYSPWKAYGQSKLACLMFALELQRRSDAAGWNLISNAAHPGPNQPVRERSGQSCFSCDRFRGSIVRSFRGGRRPTDPVCGDEPGGKAGRLLRTGRIWRTARGTGARADHAAGARRGSGRQTLGCFRETGGYIIRMTIGGCNWQKTSSGTTVGWRRRSTK